MTNQAFVKALRGPEDTTEEINPLSWLQSAIDILMDPEKVVSEYNEDPDAYFTMVAELQRLHGRLTAALAAHDAGQPEPDAMRCAICGWTVDTSQPPVRPLPPRKKPEVVMSAKALAAVGTLEKLAF